MPEGAIEDPNRRQTRLAGRGFLEIPVCCPVVTDRRSRLVGGGMALTGGCEDYGWKALAGRTELPGTKGRGHPVPVGAAASAFAWARLSRHPRGVSFHISRCG